MSTNSDETRFLQAVFPDYVKHAIFVCDLASMWPTRTLEKLDATRDCFWSIAAFPDDNSTHRKLVDALEVRALVIDDVGTKIPEAAVVLAFGPPTAVIETSAGNFQWVYRLAAPVPVDQWPEVIAEFEALVGHPFDGKDAVHLFRLPMGVNTKPGKGEFAPILTQLNSGIELSAPLPTGNTSGTSGPPASGPGPSGQKGLSGERTNALMDLIPNDLSIDREAWIEIGHGIKALAENDEEGFEVFNNWSATWEGGAYDEGYTRKRWDSFGAGGLLSKGGKLRARAQAVNPEGFARWDAKLAFDDDVEPPDEVPPMGLVKFDLGSQKEILKTLRNAERAALGLGITCKYDEFHHRVEIHRPNGDVEPLTDDAVLLLRGEFIDAYGKEFGRDHVGDAIKGLALRNGYNPVTIMLADAEAQWDGIKRLDRLAPDYFHTDDTELARVCFRKVMLAAVRRARSPGCKFDQILVIESPEGWDKSTAWAVLAGSDNFSDADILGKDARQVQEELCDIWIHEIADLSGLTRADVEHVKAFASRTRDRARPAYGHFLVDQPRHSIEVGTTNSDSYLLASTGNRRFWPFTLNSPVDLGRLRADRLQLWGEAAALESGGETLVLDQRLWGAAGVEQEKRRVVDLWEDELNNLVEMPAGAIAPVGCERIETHNGEQFITSLSVSAYLKDDRRITLYPGAGRKIAEIMRKLGWRNGNVWHHGKATRGFLRTVPTPNAAPANSVRVGVRKNVMKKVF